MPRTFVSRILFQAQQRKSFRSSHLLRRDNFKPREIEASL